MIAILGNYHKILPFALCLLLISGLRDFHSLFAVRKYFSVYMGSFATLISLWIMVKFSSIEILGNINNLTSQRSIFGVFCFAAGFVLIAYGLISLACVVVSELDLVNEIKALKRKMGEYANLKKTALAIFVLYLISFSSIILADVEYIDDMGRKVTGNTGWEDFSRYLSNIVSQVINTNSYLADVSPLTQLIAVVVITISSLIVLMVFTDQKKFSFWNIIAVLPLGISPYFLECITYKYDSPYMALSVLGGVFPLLFYAEDLKLYITAAVLGTLVVCTTYQAALGIFPVSVMVLLFLQWKKGRSFRDLFQLMLRSVCGYCIGLFGWRYFLMKPVVSTYTSSDIYSLQELPAGLYSNLGRYLGNVYQDFDPLWLICTVVIFVCFIALETITAEKKEVAYGSLCCGNIRAERMPFVWIIYCYVGAHL
ncbi:MAG: glucosyltransferase domain-containing protein [Lachnospiraceae bacterium]|nr:glucosyltransferase domain-containing protein [Lachnospiraceae bacterium]